MKLHLGRETCWVSNLSHCVSIRRSALVCALLGLSIAGCGGEKGPKREAVSGKVTRETIPIDAGSITFTPTGGGPPAVGSIENGEYKFDASTGPVAGTHKVAIVHFPKREEVPPGTPKKDAAIIKDTRFKKATPLNGWEKPAEVKEGQKDPIDFKIDE